MIATTATATERVAKDILTQIPGKVEYIRGNLMRDNFSLHVIKVDNQDVKLACVEDIVNSEKRFRIVYKGFPKLYFKERQH